MDLPLNITEHKMNSNNSNVKTVTEEEEAELEQQRLADEPVTEIEFDRIIEREKERLIKEGRVGEEEVAKVMNAAVLQHRLLFPRSQRRGFSDWYNIQGKALWLSV